MNAEIPEQDPNSADTSAELGPEQPGSYPPNEGDISSTTWVNPNVPGYTVRRVTMRREIDYTLTTGQPSIVRAIFGSVIVLTDKLGGWASLNDEDVISRQMGGEALRQAVEQVGGMDDRPFAALRYGLIGLFGRSLDAAQHGAGRLSGLTDLAGRSAGKVASPVWNSFLFAPLHEPMLRAEKAGEDKVKEWIQRGQIEELRSRNLAEAGISNFLEESVTEITENDQVQMIVQQVVASQSTGLVTEILEQIRQRIVNFDHTLLSRVGRAEVSPPDFREDYLQALRQKRLRYRHADLDHSLAGTYAGPLARLAAFLLDVVILILIASLLSTFVSSSLALFGLTDDVASFLVSGRTISSIVLAFIGLFNFLLIAVYFIVFWDLIGSTPGDLVLGIRVVNKEGRDISFIGSFLRAIGWVISAVFLFLGFIWAIFDRRHQGWLDKIAGTFVVYDWAAEPWENPHRF